MTTAPTYNTGTGPCFTIVNTLTVVFQTRDVNRKLLSVIEGREIRPKLKQTSTLYILTQPEYVEDKIISQYLRSTSGASLPFFKYFFVRPVFVCGRLDLP